VEKLAAGKEVIQTQQELASPETKVRIQRRNVLGHLDDFKDKSLSKLRPHTSETG